MKTDSTSWSQLSAEIEQYKKRAKHNLENYERQRFNNLYRKKSQKKVNTQESDSSLKKLTYSMNLIRERIHQQKQKKQNIHTKIGFLKTQRDRKIQSSQRARKKFEKVFSIRSQSASEKELMTKQISLYNARSYYIKRQLTERAKSERLRIQSERKKMLSQNSTKAKQVRKTRIQNEQSIVQEKVLNLQKKQKAVKKVQYQIMASLEKKRGRQKQIIQQGRANHYRHIREEYLKLQRAKKQNTQIFKHFQLESSKIIQQTERAQENLKMFERLLYKKNNKCLNKYDQQQKTQEKKGELKSGDKVDSNQKETTHMTSSSPKTNIFHLTN